MFAALFLENSASIGSGSIHNQKGMFSVNYGDDDSININIFDKYHSGEEVYNSPPYELFEEFKDFYGSLL